MESTGNYTSTHNLTQPDSDKDSVTNGSNEILSGFWSTLLSKKLVSVFLICFGVWSMWPNEGGSGERRGNSEGALENKGHLDSEEGPENKAPRDSKKTPENEVDPKVIEPMLKKAIAKKVAGTMGEPTGDDFAGTIAKPLALLLAAKLEDKNVVLAMVNLSELVEEIASKVNEHVIERKANPQLVLLNDHLMIDLLIYEAVFKKAIAKELAGTMGEPMGDHFAGKIAIPLAAFIAEKLEDRHVLEMVNLSELVEELASKVNEAVIKEHEQEILRSDDLVITAGLAVGYGHITKVCIDARFALDFSRLR